MTLLLPLWGTPNLRKMMVEISPDFFSWVLLSWKMLPKIPTLITYRSHSNDSYIHFDNIGLLCHYVNTSHPSAWCCLWVVPFIVPEYQRVRKWCTLGQDVAYSWTKSDKAEKWCFVKYATLDWYPVLQNMICSSRQNTTLEWYNILQVHALVCACYNDAIMKSNTCMGTKFNHWSKASITNIGLIFLKHRKHNTWDELYVYDQT